MPNFVYIHTHDSGRFTAPYGIAADNPALMALAREGALFRNMYCAAPTCSPSRSAMLTGQSAHESGMLGLAHRGFALSDPSRHLGAYLNRNGCHSALIGVHHECDKQCAEPLGYSEWYYKKDKGNTATDLGHLAEAERFLSHAGELGKPFFLSFGMRNTHRPFPSAQHGDAGIDADFVKPPFPVADTPENRRDWCDYLQSLSEADYCVGRICDALRENGLWEDTAVLYTTDHGPAYPLMKCNLYDTGIGVSFILRLPGREHVTIDALTTQLDLYPTVCDWLGVPRPEWLEGRSLLPLIDGECDKLHDYVFAETTFHATYEPARAVRSREYKLIRFYDGGETAKLPNIDAGAAKTLYISRPLSRMPRAREMFFDLMADPCERINLVGLPEYADAYAAHASALDEWMVRTSDPILDGDMYSMGEGKRINPTDGIDPDNNTFTIEKKP